MPKDTAIPTLAILEVVGFDQFREIASIKEPGSDRVKYLTAVSGTRKSFVDVRTKNGQIFRLPVDQDSYEAICGDTMSNKSVRQIKNVSGHPLPSSYARDRVKENQERYGSLDSIDFKRAWSEAQLLDSTLPPIPPKYVPEEAQKAITLLARRILKLELEWS